MGQRGQQIKDFGSTFLSEVSLGEVQVSRGQQQHPEQALLDHYTGGPASTGCLHRYPAGLLALVQAEGYPDQGGKVPGAFARRDLCPFRP